MNKKLIKNTILMALLTSVSSLKAGFKDNMQNLGKELGSGFGATVEYAMTEKSSVLFQFGSTFTGGVVYNLFSLNKGNFFFNFIPGCALSYRMLDLNLTNKFAFEKSRISADVYLINFGFKLGKSDIYFRAGGKISKPVTHKASLGFFMNAGVNYACFSEGLRLGAGFSSINVAKCNKVFG